MIGAELPVRLPSECERQRQIGAAFVRAVRSLGVPASVVAPHVGHLAAIWLRNSDAVKAIGGAPADLLAAIGR